jgi:hypothetical protein
MAKGTAKAGGGTGSGGEELLNQAKEALHQEFGRLMVKGSALPADMARMKQLAAAEKRVDQALEALRSGRK